MTILTSELGGSGGGGGVPVGTVLPIRSSDDVYTAEDGSVWLQSGTFETADGTYPDAYYEASLQYAGQSISLTANGTSVSGAAWDGTHWWVVGFSNDAIYKYNTDGTYANASISTASQVGTAQGLAWDGSHLWVSDFSSKIMYRYNVSSGSYTGESIDFSSAPNYSRGLAWDGSHLCALLGDGSIYKYALNGVFDSSFILEDYEGTPSGLIWDGEFFWSGGFSASNIKRYNSDGSYSNYFFSVSEGESGISGLAYGDGKFGVLDDSSDSLVLYAESECYGIPEATDTDSGLPLYVKVA